MKKLINIDVNEVSVVDKPANDRKFLIIKHAKGGEQNMTIEEILEKIEDEELKEGLEKAFDDKNSEIEDLEKRVEELEKDEEPDEEPDEEGIEKSELPEDVVKAMDALEKRLEVAESMAKEEYKKRREIEFTKTADGFSKVAEVDKIVNILMKADEVGEDFYNDVEAVLKSAQARIEKGVLDKPEGADTGGDATDPLAKIDELVDAMVEKSDMSREKAMVKVLEKNPGLYRAYIQGDNEE
jgi:hypothetical protein